jgi:hypothetical protein
MKQLRTVNVEYRDLKSKNSTVKTFYFSVWSKKPQIINFADPKPFQLYHADVVSQRRPPHRRWRRRRGQPGVIAITLFFSFTMLQQK